MILTLSLSRPLRLGGYLPVPVHVFDGFSLSVCMSEFMCLYVFLSLSLSEPVGLDGCLLIPVLVFVSLCVEIYVFVCVFVSLTL